MKPILFNTEMVRAILDGRKTVTRRVVKPQPESRPTPMKKDSCWPGCFAIQGTAKVIRPPYQPGDTLWVRETWAKSMAGTFMYQADDKAIMVDRWRPSIHMPREAARLFLRVKEVSVEKLREISALSAMDEGVTDWNDFVRLWNTTIKSADLPLYGWDANPWVWVIEFERIGKDEALGGGGDDCTDAH